VLLCNVFASVAPDQRILSQATDSELPDLQGAIQLYSALHARADQLLTRNVGDCPADMLPILAPNDFPPLHDWAAPAA